MTADPLAPLAPPTRRELAAELVGACRAAGTTHAFGVPGGGSNLEVVGAAADAGIDFVLAHTETAAAVMAAVTGELTGAPGLCVVTRGPGAASAVNGAAQALLDRQPLLLVTDRVPAEQRERVSHQRLDQRAMLAPVTLASVVLDGRDPDAAARAVRWARSAPPGPVHVEIDAAPVAPVPPAAPPEPGSPDGPDGPDDTDGRALEAVLALVRRCERPVLMVGLGAVAQPPPVRRALVAAIRDLGRRTAAPTLCTYRARGVVADDSSWNAGVLTGATLEARVLEAADLIIGIGIDPVELIPAAWPYPAPVLLLGTWPVRDSSYFGPHLAAEAVGSLPELVHAVGSALVSTWPAEVGERFRSTAEAALAAASPPVTGRLGPRQVIQLAREAAPPDTIATVDAGAHMLLAVPLWRVGHPCRLLVSSGLATMGFALPAAIAAALARPGAPVVCLTGDGGLGMALAELETVARLQLPVVVVVFNDSTLSLIAAKADPSRHGGPAAVSYRDTDFAAIARGFGMSGERVRDVSGYRGALERMFTGSAPGVIDVQVDPGCYPAVLAAIRGAGR